MTLRGFLYCVEFGYLALWWYALLGPAHQALFSAEYDMAWLSWTFCFVVVQVLSMLYVYQLTLA
jgi:hypothetical protein